MTDTIVAYHAEDEWTPARPAINVKLHCAGLDLWPREFVAAYGHDDTYPDDNSTAGNLVESAYERIASDFWQAAEEIATQRGLGEIEQQGRSGGWLVFTDGRDPQTLAQRDDDWLADGADGDTDYREGWLFAYRSMVEWADTWIADAPRKVVALAQQMAMDEAGEEPARRAFPAAFGGCNGHSIYYASVTRGDAIMAGYELQDDDDDPPDDGKVLIAGVLYDAETGWEADEDGPPPDLNREGDPTLNGSFR